MRSRVSLRVLVTAVLLAGLGLVGAAARAARPAPFGDSVTVVGAAPGAAGALRVAAGAVEGYDVRTGAVVWSYRRDGHRPLRLVPVGTTTVAVWDDGMLTGMEPAPAVVRWHRYVPGVGPGTPLLLVPFGAGESFLVLTRDVVMTYNTGDGTLRTSTLPSISAGCFFRDSGPAGPVHAGSWVLARRDCADGAGRTELEGFDLDGRRWQRPALAPVRMTATPDGGVDVLAVPAGRPRAVDPATGRPARECVCAAR